ncbi:HEPN domain-containing protein [Billgrantia montanilacus]
MDISDAPYLDQHQMRSVVNRAYYAAYITARDFCEAKGFQGSGSSHQRVIEALKGKPQWRATANRLQQMKELRHQADYDWQNPMRLRDAQSAMKTSQKVIEALQ